MSQFKAGDRVFLNDWRHDPTIGKLYPKEADKAVGCIGTIISFYGVHATGARVWVVMADIERTWPEDYLRLEEEPKTVPSMKAVSPADDPPQWKVSRAISWEHGHCACGCPRARCSYHSTPADIVAASFGADFAAAHAAGWKP